MHISHPNHVGCGPIHNEHRGMRWAKTPVIQADTIEQVAPSPAEWEFHLNRSNRAGLYRIPLCRPELRFGLRCSSYPFLHIVAPLQGCGGWTFRRTASAFRRLFTEPPRRPISAKYSEMMDFMFMRESYQSRFGLSSSAANPQLRKSGFAALYSHYFSCSERQ